MYIYIHIHTYIHTYIYIHIHTQTYTGEITLKRSLYQSDQITQTSCTIAPPGPQGRHPHTTKVPYRRRHAANFKSIRQAVPPRHTNPRPIYKRDHPQHRLQANLNPSDPAENLKNTGRGAKPNQPSRKPRPLTTKVESPITLLPKLAFP